jgi:hypothetical protein
VNQGRWLTENEVLSNELRDLILRNESLVEEIARLKEALHAREQQLYTATGVVADYEEF